MSTEVTVEQNKVIAEFMGLKFRVIDYPNGQQNVQEIDIGGYWATCKYHEDWNQLHIAWGKLYALHTPKVFFVKFINPMYNAMIKSDIAEAHKILHDAIVWYNSNK